MKTISFVKWQLKKWLPLFAVLGILVLATVMINALTTRMTFTSTGYFSDGNYIGNKPFPRFSGLQLIGNMVMIPACIVPFFVFSHRFDKNAADAYRAFPAPKRRITRTKILIGGAYILGLVILVYLTMIGIMGLRYSTLPEGQLERGFLEVKYDYYFIWYLPAFFYLLISALASYLFNCTLVSFGNNSKSAFIYMLFGNILMFLVAYTIVYSFVYLPVRDHPTVTLKNMIYYDGVSWFGGHFGRMEFVEKTFHNLVVANKLDSNFAYDGLFSFGKILGYIAFLAEIGIGVYAFFVDEPSGEHYGAPGARKEFHKAIIYGGLAVSLLVIADGFGGSSFSIADVMILLFAITIIYFIFVIFNKRFALNINDTIAIICLGFFYVVAVVYVRLMYDATRSSYYGGEYYYVVQTLSTILRNR